MKAFTESTWTARDTGLEFQATVTNEPTPSVEGTAHISDKDISNTILKLNFLILLTQFRYLSLFCAA